MVMEGDWATSWTIEDGVISVDSDHIIQYDEGIEALRVTNTPTAWILVPVGAAPAPVAVPEPVVAPVAVPEPVPEPVAAPEPVAVPEPEPESEEEDVPVARSAALIEEALNAQAADAAKVHDEEEA
jgi:hypothetical protein